MRSRRERLELRGGAARPARKRFSGLTILTLGALAPFAIYGIVVGGMVMLRGGGEPARIASAASIPGLTEPAPVDCDSPRFSWRSECRSAEGPTKAAATSEESPTATGALERKPSGRASTVKTASAELAEPTPAATLVASPSAAAKQTPAASVGAAPPQASRIASAGVKPDLSASEAAAKSPVLDFEDAEADPTAPRNTLVLKPREGAKPESDGKRPARPARESDTPEPSSTAAAAPAENPVAASDSSEAEKPAKATKSRAKPKSKARLAAERRQRLQAARGRDLEELPPPPGGYSVTSYRTIEYPDGRQVTMRVQSRPDVVRGLIARHNAERARALALPADGFYRYERPTSAFWDY